MVDIISQDMTGAQRYRLADSVQNVIQDLRVEDFTLLLPLLLSNAPLKDLVVRQIASFIQNELSMTVAA